MTDNFYATPELAVYYDEDSGDRPDFDFYASLAGRLRAGRVIDIGCGTGRLASRLAGAGHEVLGLDPQPTMLDLARQQPHAAAVHWLEGTADDLPTGWADLVLMTGHVAQYFLTDEAWVHVLTEARRSLRPSGHLAFEIRNDVVEAWRGWSTTEPVASAAGDRVTVVRLDGDVVTHTSTWTRGNRSRSTVERLRFPTWAVVERGLDSAVLAVTDRWGSFAGDPIRDDCPEWIVLARPATG